MKLERASEHVARSRVNRKNFSRAGAHALVPTLVTPTQARRQYDLALGAKEDSNDARSTNALRCALILFGNLAGRLKTLWPGGKATRQGMLRACENVKICESVKAICTWCREHRWYRYSNSLAQGVDFRGKVCCRAATSIMRQGSEVKSKKSAPNAKGASRYKRKQSWRHIDLVDFKTPPSLPASAEAAPHSPHKIEMSATIGGALPPAMQAR